jgi:AraC-like DNA-binding protein
MKYDPFELFYTFHFSTGLPVALYAASQCVQSLPEDIRSVPVFLDGGDALSSLGFSPDQQLVAQYVANRYEERYIYFQINDELSLLVGPVLTEPMMEGAISNLIRKNRLPIKRKSALTEHYASMRILDETAYFYAGKLMELLFISASIPVQNNENTANRESALVEKYHKSTYENRINLFSHPPYFMEQEISRLITAGDKINSEKLLTRINTERRAVLAKEPLRSLKNSLIASCTLFTRAAIAGGASPDAAFTLSDTYILEIENDDSLKSLNDFEGKMLAGFVDMVNGINENRYSRVIRNAIEYINNSLSEKITIADIAEKTFVHPNYLSTLFKKETGSTLSNYILSRRVEEAKYFIRYGSNAMSDIANFYQFCSQSHFIATFKKFTGMTPAQYRAQSVRRGAGKGG